MTAARAPRWRCGDPKCPKHPWQRVSAVGEYDPIDAALGDLETHWQHEHPSDDLAKQEGPR